MKCIMIQVDDDVESVKFEDYKNPKIIDDPARLGVKEFRLLDAVIIRKNPRKTQFGYYIPKELLDEQKK